MARIERSIEVDVPVRTAYNQWTQFEEFPRFMEGVKEVAQVDDSHLHWRTEIAGKDKEWDAEITEQVPDQVIAWRSVSGTENRGTVSFQPLGPNRTRINLVMEYDAEGFLENVGDVLGMTGRRVEGDLERFKRFIESRGHETGAWRGEVHQGQATRSGTGIAEEYTGAPATAAGGPSAPSEQRRAATLGSHDPAYWTGERDRRRGERRRREAMMPASSARAPAPRRLARWPQRWSGAAGSWLDEPFVALRRMAEEMDQMFDRMLGRPASSESGFGALPTAWAPQVDVAQRGDEVVIRADLPGIRKEDVHIDIQEGMLTIEGEREEESEHAEHGYHRIERTHGHFHRSIPLPEGADIDAARASMSNGVLEITMPAPHRGRRLEIGGGEDYVGQRRTG